MPAKWNSIYYRLFFSYALLLLVTALAIGSAAYLYFSAHFKREVEKVNSRLLQHMSEQLYGNAIGKAQKLLMQAATDPDVLFLFNNPLRGNASRLADARQYVGSLPLQYPEVVDSAAVYYREHRAVVSSEQGIALLDSIPDKASADIGWVERIERSDRAMLWLGPRRVAVHPGSDTFSADVVTLVSRFPYQAQPDKTKGYIAVSLKAEALEGMIRSHDLSDNSQLWIADGDGRPIASGNSRAGLSADELALLWGRIGQTDGGSASGSYSASVGGHASLVSYVSVPGADWKLVQVTPLSDYYRGASAILRVLLLICLGAIALGLIVSNMLTFKLYRPLRSLLRTIRDKLGASLPDRGASMNEYSQIDELFSSMSDKVNELESAVKDQVPLIRHHLATGLLNGTIVDRTEFAEKQRYLRMEWERPFYCALLIRLDQTGMERLGVGQRQIVVYNLIREIGRTEDDGLGCLAVSMHPAEIAVAVHGPGRDEEAVRRRLDRALAFAGGQFGLRAVAAIGDWTDDPLRLHDSYRSATAYIEYDYFMPEARVFAASRFGEAAGGGAAFVPEAVVARFAEALRAKDREAVRRTLDDYAALMESGAYSAESGHETWRQLVDAYRLYVKEMHLKAADILGEELAEPCGRAGGSRGLQSWLTAAAERTFAYVEERARNKSAEAIEQVKQFVERHLDCDLSLNAVAESVKLHPGYISKRFKEETGVNFVDYVNERRIQAAVHWLRTTDWNVERVASRVGFNTTAYFIRKFRDVYGLTPKAYQTNYRLRQGD